MQTCNRPEPYQIDFVPDVAWALVEARQMAEATAVPADLRERVPARLRHQQYARDIVSSTVVRCRRALSQELADLASLVGWK